MNICPEYILWECAHLQRPYLSRVDSSREGWWQLCFFSVKVVICPQLLNQQSIPSRHFINTGMTSNKDGSCTRLYMGTDPPGECNPSKGCSKQRYIRWATQRDKIIFWCDYRKIFLRYLY